MGAYAENGTVPPQCLQYILTKNMIDEKTAPPECHQYISVTASTSIDNKTAIENNTMDVTNWIQAFSALLSACGTIASAIVAYFIFKLTKTMSNQTEAMNVHTKTVNESILRQNIFTERAFFSKAASMVSTFITFLDSAKESIKLDKVELNKVIKFYEEKFEYIDDNFENYRHFFTSKEIISITEINKIINSIFIYFDVDKDKKIKTAVFLNQYDYFYIINNDVEFNNICKKGQELIKELGMMLNSRFPNC